MRVIEVESKTQTMAVIYARVSSVAQLQKGHGLESQTTRCREFAKHKGYEVVEVFHDKAVSGGVVDRPRHNGNACFHQRAAVNLALYCPHR